VSRKKTETVDFEQGMSELEAIVARLEQGDLTLEESLRQFERGVTLTRSCQNALRTAEQRVEILARRSGQNAETVEFEPEDGDSRA
jgi:exodeoxyribonuclease VII small subunit